jgi:hypothetical protein
MLVLADSPYKMNSKIPLIALRKNSNFADDEFSIYSKNNPPNFEPSDIASTLSALLSVNVPLHNQGRYIDEIIELANYKEQERKIIYIDLREQQQKISLKFLDCIFIFKRIKFLKILEKQVENPSPKKYKKSILVTDHLRTRVWNFMERKLEILTK